MVELIDRPPATGERETRLVPSSKDQVPALGLRNYWYPAIEAHRVQAKPVPVRILGEDLVFFRDRRDGRVAALHDRCPHKGMPLSCARVYFPGTLSCAYHGWTFDGDGELRAVLSEGPDSKLPGKVRVRSYPVEERWGVVWVFMGELDSPPPLEEDVPIEHFDPGTTYTLSIQVWNGDWRDGMENSADASHAQVLHRHAFLMWLVEQPAWAKMSAAETADGKAIGIYKEFGPPECDYPGLGHYSMKRWFRRPAQTRRRLEGDPRRIQQAMQQRRATNQIRLPCWRIVDLHPIAYVQGTVPIDEGRTRFWAFSVKRTSGLGALLFRLRYLLWSSWVMDRLFVGQDKWAIERLKPGPEKFHANDVAVIKWRQLAGRAAKQRI
jgi:phenylpropionate dioxygenase-like ring-hydroxylating dioxygenase large terminal subunit